MSKIYMKCVNVTTVNIIESKKSKEEKFIWFLNVLVSNYAISRTGPTTDV